MFKPLSISKAKEVSLNLEARKIHVGEASLKLHILHQANIAKQNKTRSYFTALVSI